MANEITLTAKLSVSKNGITATNAVSTKAQTMESTVEKIHHTVQAVGTAREALSVGDVDITNATGDEYWALIYNRDATYTITVEVQTGAATYAPIGVLRPGEPWGPVRMPKLDASGYGGLFLDASTACDAEVLVCEAGDPAL